MQWGAADTAAVASVASPLCTGAWIWFHFRKEAPFRARVALTVLTELRALNGIEMAIVTVTASTIGKGRLELDFAGLVPAVVIYPITAKHLWSPPSEWGDEVEPIVAVDMFNGENVIEAGETISDGQAVALWAGPRPSDLFGFRSEFILKAKVPSGEKETWRIFHMIVFNDQAE
jgi:hypothetical protein